jgi:HK97 family phage prohead protease
MPWHLDSNHAGCSGWAVVLDAGSKVVGCHPTKAKAQAHLAALNANVKEASSMVTKQKQHVGRPPRDNLVRAMPGGFELRASTEPDGMPTLFGHFIRWGEWAEIDSIFEGRFLERFERGALTKTFNENRASMRVTFQHGRDPHLGDKVLGPIDELEEDSVGARYAVPLFDTAYNREILPGLEAGVYGASFRFRSMREEFEDKPGVSDFNPEGIPQRTVKEAMVPEFGPVTFPAYAGSTAGVRSMTDEFVFGSFTAEPERLVELIEHIRATRSDAPPEDPAPSDAGQKPTSERRVPLFGQGDEKEAPEWLL